MLFSILLLHVLCLGFGAFSQERQNLWLPKDDLKDSSAWSSPPLVLLRDIHDGLLAKYDCKDNTPPPDQPGSRARPTCDSQDGVSQEETDPLLLPQIDRLNEDSSRGEDASNTVVIPPSTGSHRKSSHGDICLKTSRGHLWSRVERNSVTFTHNNT